MKCPCCGNEVCALNALLSFMVEQEELEEQKKKAEHVKQIEPAKTSKNHSDSQFAS